MVITINNLATISSVTALVPHINDHINDKELVFDFNPIAFAKIIPAAILAREIKSVVKYRKERQLITRALQERDSSPLEYLRYISYFKLIGLDSGNNIRTSCQTTNYIPVTEYSYLHFKNLAESDSFRSVQDYIEIESDELSKLFSQRRETVELISYALKEIIRNVYEHSNADKVYIMGQYWKNGNVQIAILDEGVGLLRTLEKKYPELNNDFDAINVAVQPGVSGIDFSNNPNDNSGFGLYVISRLAKRLGSCVICSGRAGILFSQTGNDIFRTNNSGTLVCIHFREIPQNYACEFQQIIDEGNRIAQQSKYPISASKRTTSFLR